MSDARIPAAPVDSVISETVDRNVTIVMAVLCAIALVWALVHWRRTGRPTVLMLFLAGGAMMVMEPFVDTVGACWFPDNSMHAFTLWNRPMPVWLCLTYFVYFGIGGGLTWLVISRGATARHIWMLFGGAMVADFVLETTLLRWDTWVYYGHQPLVVEKFPLWWAPVNALVDIVLVTVIVLSRDRLQGARMLLIIPMAVAISAAVNTVTGLPSWTAISSDLGDVPRQVLGLTTFAIAVIAVRMVIRVIAVPARTIGAPGLPVREPALAGPL